MHVLYIFRVLFFTCSKLNLCGKFYSGWYILVAVFLSSPPPLRGFKKPPKKNGRKGGGETDGYGKSRIELFFSLRFIFGGEGICQAKTEGVYHFATIHNFQHHCKNFENYSFWVENFSPTVVGSRGNLFLSPFFSLWKPLLKHSSTSHRKRREGATKALKDQMMTKTVFCV